MKIHGRMDINSLVHKLKHQTKYSSSGLRVSVAASVLGVAGLIFAIKGGKVRNLYDQFGIRIPWSSPDGDITASEEFWVVPGLQNLGNNCFLNVILQALASCSSFRRFLASTMEVFECSEDLPLTMALASLVEELCTLRHGRIVLSPRKMMLAMDNYLPKFNLTCQQDAEEAFFHLISSLREELSECYVPDESSLADVIALPDCRIVSSKSKVAESGSERWRRSVLGPFNGILRSALTCRSCSFQIALDFQFFHSLLLSPVLSGGSAIIAGCSLEDCLKQFFSSEKLENYFCSHCWHIAAMRYLSITLENQGDIEKLKHCNEEDSCDCKNLSSLGAFPWSNSWSHSCKQLHIAHSPKILCINLQRASINAFGEMVKLQGHISFPLNLDLAPFMGGLGIANLEENVQNERSKQRYQSSYFSANYINMQSDSAIGQTRKRGTDIAVEFDQTVSGVPNTSIDPARKTELGLPRNGVPKDGASCSTPAHTGVKMHRKFSMACSQHHLYQLVSVVRHFGRVGHGHYIVYRRVTAKPSYEDPVGLLESSFTQWFCISDSEVYCVSEKDVLDEEASLLFYEKIS